MWHEKPSQYRMWQTHLEIGSLFLLMFFCCDLLIMPTSSLFKIWEECSFFFFFLLFSGRGAGGGSVLHYEQWKDQIMSFLVTSFFSAGLIYFWGLVALLSPSAHTFLTTWLMVELYITNNNNNTNKTICKQSPVVIVVTLQVCAKVYVCIWMYVLEDFLETFFVFYLFIDSLGATGVHCELYSEGLDIPSFIDFRNAEH